MPENIGYQFNRLYAAPIETYRQVNTITNRNAIPPEIRWEGMQCYVVTENQDYQLVGGVDNSNWVNAGETVSNPTTHFKGFFNATTVTPAISNLNGIEGDEYKVTNGGVNVDFGAGNVFLETDDIIIFYQSEWRVKVRPDSVGTLTANRALLSDASGKVDVSTVTSAELGYVSGVTSAIQTQLNAKLAASSYTASDVLSKLLTVDGSGSGLDADLLRGVHWGNVNTNIITSAQMGIGVTPLTGVHLSSPTDLTTVGLDDKASIRLTNTYADAFNSGAELQFALNDTDVISVIKGAYDAFSGGNTGGSLRFYTRNSDGNGLIERMRIRASGNISIGNTNNTYKLDVTGTGRFTGTAIAAPATLSTELVTKGQLDAAARPYKVYTALLSQSGTSAPTANVLENTLGGTIAWTRTGIGAYSGTLSISGFTVNKTIPILNLNRAVGGDDSQITRVSSTVVNIQTTTNGSLADSLLNTWTLVEIRVYN